MDIFYLLLVVWRKKFLIVGIAILAVVGAFFATNNLPKIFVSTSQISTGFVTNEGIKVTDERFNIRDASMKFSNLISAMGSSLPINMLSYRLVLHDLDSANTPFARDPKRKARKFSKEEITIAQEILTKQLQDMQPLVVGQENSKLLIGIIQSFGYTYPWIDQSMKMRRSGTTDYIQISFESLDPNLSAFAINAYFEEFIRYYAGQKAASTGESVNFYNELVTQKKEELDSKSDALQKFKTDSNFIGIGDQSDIGGLSELDNQQTEINSNIYGLQLRLNYLKESLPSGGSQVSYTQSNQKIIDLRSKISSINTRYIDSGSTSKILSDSLGILREQLNFELSLVRSTDTNITGNEGNIEADIKNTEIEIAIERSRLSQINTKIREIRGIMSTYVSKEAAVKALETEVQVASTEYIDAVNRYNEARNILLAATSSIKQIRKATPATNPIPSNRMMIIGFSGVLAMGLCFVVVLLVEILEGSINTSTQFENAVNIPSLGMLVKISNKKVDLDTIFKNEQVDKRNELFKHYLRNIRYEIESSNSKTFLITSTKIGEGKSFVVFSLAYVLSKLKKKVLIIDTNFKNNELSKTLQLNYGSTDLATKDNISSGLEILSLRGEEGEPHLNSVVLKTKYENIFLISNQGGQESPQEVLPAEEFKKLIEALGTKFDYILMEGPALNDFADTKELIQYVDKVLLVFSAGNSIKQMDKISIEYLASLEEKLIGSILNKVDRRNINL